MITFKDLDFHPMQTELGIQARTYFSNGYGVSVIRSPFSYGGNQELYELAIGH